METMINLNDLLKHEILDLYSVEEQIIDAMPSMIEKAKNPELQKALREHLKITEEQKSRLDTIKQTFGEGDGESENKGFFSRLFGGGSGGEKCKGIEGILSEGQKIMNADITDEALDAAIIASAQKVEHYEICGYGTARAFARELQLAEVERLLTQTLNEEYQADDRLTALAVGKLNVEAEQADGMDNGNGSSARSNTSSANGNSKSSSRSNGSSKSSVKTSSATSGKAGSSPKTSSSKASKPSGGSKVSSSKSGNSRSAGRGGSSKVTGRSSTGRGAKSTASKTASKVSASRSASKSNSKSIW